LKGAVSMPARRFPPPWSAEVQPNHYVVRDANKQPCFAPYHVSGVSLDVKTGDTMTLSMIVCAAFGAIAGIVVAGRGFLRGYRRERRQAKQLRKILEAAKGGDFRQIEKLRKILEAVKSRKGVSADEVDRLFAEEN
jgi:hypothetical protein